MVKKMNRAQPEGFAQPEIRPGDKWRDIRGDIVTISAFGHNRVTYVREGYEHPCIFPVSRFRSEFTRIQLDTFAGWRAVKNPLEKTRKLKELIASGRGVKK